MSTTDTASAAEALRLKEKELKRREDAYKDKMAELLKTKTVLESVLQELDAREVVLTEAEAKHGTLLKREEECEVRERDVTDRERRLKDRQNELAAREAAFQVEVQAQREEHERRMFPLAALEQEVYRREEELRSLEVDHEVKLRAFQKRVHQEEERERTREKQVRDLETRAKESLAKVERREKELETAQTNLNERTKALKAEQVELESRDRDQKWRDEQLRLAQAEVHLTKGRLMTWERQLDTRHEQQETRAVELLAKTQELTAKELAVSERMSRLLSAEKELQEKEKQTAAALARAKELNESAAQRANSLGDEHASIEEQRRAVAEEHARAEAVMAAAAKKDEAAAKKKAKIEQKEAAIKDWVAELEWREQQLLKREQQYGRDLNAATGATAGRSSVTNLSGGLVRSQLARATESYLGGSAQPASRKLKPMRDEPKPDLTVVRAEDALIAADLDKRANAVGNRFAQCSVKFYSMSDEGVRHVFSTNERELFKSCFEAEEQWKEDLRFLDQVFVVNQQTGQSAVPLALSTTTQWQQWFAGALEVATYRRSQLQSLRLSKLTAVVDLFMRKEESESLSQYFPLNHFKVLREQRAAQFAAGATDDQAPLETGLVDDASSPQPTSGSTKKPANKSVTQMQEDIKRALEALPPYLRKHYESGEAPPQQQQQNDTAAAAA